MNGGRLAWQYALLAIVTHAVFIAVSLRPGFRESPVVSGDSVTYVMSAENLFERRRFSRERTPPFLWEPYRTPGYPAAIAASLWLTGDVKWTLFLAALSAGAAAWCAVRLAIAWGGGLAAGHAAGLLAALLPNSIGLSGLLLTDAIFGHLMLMWLWCTWTLYRTGGGAALGGAAASLAAMQLLKPSMNMGGLLVICAALLLARSAAAWRMTAVLVLLTLPLPLLCAARNLRDHGVFSPSLLGVATIREDLMARWEAEQRGLDGMVAQQLLRTEDRAESAALPGGGSRYEKLYRVQYPKAREFFVTHPGTALRLMLAEMGRQFVAPQEFPFKVMRNDVPQWARVAGSVLTLLLWALAVAGAWTMWRSGAGREAALVGATVLFVLATASVSSWQAARLRFPADMASVPIAGLGAARLVTSVRGPRG